MVMRGKKVIADAHVAQVSQLQAGFLGHFTPRRLARRFSSIDPAARQLPFESTAFAFAPPEQYAPGIGYDYRNSTLNPLTTGIDVFAS